MRLIRIDHNPSSRQLNVFGVVWLVFFTAVGAVLLWNGTSVRVAALVWGIAIVLPAIGWIVTGFMRLIFVGMAYAAFPIGFAVSFVMMVMVYYLLMTPTGLVMRLLGYDPMNRHFDGRADTYWCPREQGDNPNRYFRQF